MILGLIIKFSFLPQFVLEILYIESTEFNLNVVVGVFFIPLKFFIRVVGDIVAGCYYIYQDESILPYTNNSYDEEVILDSSINPNMDNPINFLEKKGESSNANTTNTNTISMEDYSWTSDEESSDSHKEPHTNPEPKVLDENEKKDLEAARQKHELEIFEREVLNKSSLDELAATLDELEIKKNEYKSSGSNVPAAKTQIALLEEEIRMCTEKLSEKMNELESKEAEGKGKEVEGKGKEAEK